MELFIEGITAVDPAYNNIRDGDHHMDVKGRELCNALWEVFEPYADPHFRAEFQNDFDARFWEMDLTCAFIEKGYSVSCPKPGPDICLDSGVGKVWIEAIAPENGNGRDRVPERRFGVAQSVPDEQIILRFTSSIAEKHRKFRSYLENRIIANDEPYIIAVNGCQLSFSRSDFEPPRIVRAVFPIGHQYVTFDKDNGKFVGGGFEFKPAVRKASGTDIPIDIFLNPEFEGVSAILFSNTDCCNRPENMGDDYILVHNPLAKNKLTEGYIQFGRECIAEQSNETEYGLRWISHKNA